MLKTFVNNPNNEYIYDEEGNSQSREVANKHIYLKNREKYPLDFKKYVVHHIDGDTFNNSIKNLYICTKEQHRAIHDKQEELRKKFFNTSEIDFFLKGIIDKEQTVLTNIDVKLKRIKFENKMQKRYVKNNPSLSTENIHSIHSSQSRNGVGLFFGVIFVIAVIGYLIIQIIPDSNSTAVANNNIIFENSNSPFFEFQKRSMTKEEIDAEIANKILEYESSTQGFIRKCNVYYLAEAWKLPRPTKEYGSGCVFTFNINGYDSNVKVIFQGDCTGCKTGYQVVVEPKEKK